MKTNRKESGVSVWLSMVQFCQEMFNPRVNAGLIEEGNTHYYVCSIHQDKQTVQN